MSGFLDVLRIGLAIAAVGGAVLAVSARVPRLAVLGLLIALLASPFVAQPLPTAAVLGVRLVAGVLAAALVWIAVREAVPGAAGGTRLGWPGELAVAAAAYLAGALIAGGLGLRSAVADPTAPLPPADPVVAAGVGAAAALAVLAAGPVLLARDAVRLGSGLLLALAAGGVLHSALLGSMNAGAVGVSDVAQLAFAAATATTGAAVAWLCARTLDERTALELVERRRASAAGAHRMIGDAEPSRPARRREPAVPAAAPVAPSPAVMLARPAAPGAPAGAEPAATPARPAARARPITPTPPPDPSPPDPSPPPATPKRRGLSVTPHSSITTRSRRPKPAPPPRPDPGEPGSGDDPPPRPRTRR